MRARYTSFCLALVVCWHGVQGSIACAQNSAGTRSNSGQTVAQAQASAAKADDDDALPRIFVSVRGADTPVILVDGRDARGAARPDGRHLILLNPGRYTLSARADSVQCEEVKLVVESGERVDLTVGCVAVKKDTNESAPFYAVFGGLLIAEGTLMPLAHLVGETARPCSLNNTCTMEPATLLFSHGVGLATLAAGLMLFVGDGQRGWAHAGYGLGTVAGGLAIGLGIAAITQNGAESCDDGSALGSCPVPVKQAGDGTLFGALIIGLGALSAVTAVTGWLLDIVSTKQKTVWLPELSGDYAGLRIMGQL